jgi:hypothetical protein
LRLRHHRSLRFLNSLCSLLQACGQDGILLGKTFAELVHLRQHDLLGIRGRLRRRGASAGSRTLIGGSSLRGIWLCGRGHLLFLVTALVTALVTFALVAALVALDDLGVLCHFQSLLFVFLIHSDEFDVL